MTFKTRMRKGMAKTDAHSNKNDTILEGATSRMNSQLFSNMTAHPFLTPLIFRDTNETDYFSSVEKDQIQQPVLHNEKVMRAA